MIKDAAKFLHDTGLLFEINRQVLHPLGLALAIRTRIDGKIAFGEILDCRHDPEGFIFDEDTLKEGSQKHQAYMDEHGGKALVSRVTWLGFTIQPLPGDSRPAHRESSVMSQKVNV